MRKILLCFGILLCSHSSSEAQIMGALPQYPLPTVSGPVSQPQTTNTTTLQQVVTTDGSVNNFYVHSWDITGIGSFRGIAWRTTNTGGGLMSQGHLMMAGPVYSIDVALFQDAAKITYVLAAYYLLGPEAEKGYYYEVYRFDPAGVLHSLIPRTPLQVGVPYAGINVDVDAETMNLAIIWCNPSEGLHIKTFKALTMGPELTLPGTSTYRNPDVCISKEPGDEWIHIAYRSAASNYIGVLRWKFNDAFGMSFSSLAGVYTSPLSLFGYGIPRIDAPDLAAATRWATVYAERTATDEKIYVAVKNELWTIPVMNVTVHTAASTTTYDNNPVLAYNNTANKIQVGWVTKTATLSGNCYVAEGVLDPGTATASVQPNSYVYISNTVAGPTPTTVLAFSGQNTKSNYTGLHAVYSLLGTFFPSNYSMVYKDKPWLPVTFRTTGTEDFVPVSTIYPNPFSEQLSVKLPLKGIYDISIISIEGKVVYTQHGAYEAMEPNNINTAQFNPGIYFLRIVSVENNIDETRKLVK